MMSDDTFTIRLRIGKYVFPLSVRKSDEPVYRKAEVLINSRLGYYSQNYPGQSEIEHLLMALLEMAVVVKQNELRNDTQPFVNTMLQLQQEVEAALGKNK